MDHVHHLALLAVLATVLIAPAVAADHATQELAPGETYVRDVSLAAGQTLFVTFESNNSLDFMILDPGGNVVRNDTGMSGGYFIEAPADGDYRLVWRNNNTIPTTLGYDHFQSDREAADRSITIMVLALAAIMAAAVITFLLMRRRR